MLQAVEQRAKVLFVRIGSDHFSGACVDLRPEQGLLIISGVVLNSLVLSSCAGVARVDSLSSKPISVNVESTDCSVFLQPAATRRIRTASKMQHQLPSGKSTGMCLLLKVVEQEGLLLTH